MAVVANEWYKPSRPYDAKIHAVTCYYASRRSQPEKWRDFASVETALAHYRQIGKSAEICRCLGR